MFLCDDLFSAKQLRHALRSHLLKQRCHFLLIWLPPSLKKLDQH